MGQFFRMQVEFVCEQGTVQQQLHQMLFLGFGYFGVIAGRGWWNEVALSRLLLYDNGLLLVSVQEVQTSLYTQHVTEECGFQCHVCAVITGNALSQVLSYQFPDVGPLCTCFLIEGFGLLLALEAFAGQHLQRIHLEVSCHALGKGYISVMHRIVQKLPREISQVDMFCVGLRFQTIDDTYERRFGIGLKARGHRGHVHQIVGFVDDEFGHAQAVLHAHTHQMDLCPW